LTVDRYDSIQLPSARIDADGFLHDSPILTRTGVFEYRNPDGSMRREYRPPEEVFRADSLATYKGKPITIRHPTEGEVNSRNAKRLMVGTIVSEGRQDGNNVLGDIVIHTPESMGKSRELSLGYRLDVVEEAGTTPEGEPYTHVQRNIVINHLSVVERARAGPVARLNMDGNEILEDESEGNKHMAKIRLDGIEYEAAQEVINALEKANTRADESKIHKGKLQTNLDTVTAERDSLKVKVESFPGELEKVRKDAADTLKDAVKNRVELIDTAKAFKVDKTDEMTDKDIKVAVIKAVHGDAFDVAGKSDDYINAAFDLAKADKRADAMKQQRQQVNQSPKNNRTDTNDGSAESARQKMIERQQNAYKGEKGDK
jgi:hypothetical protein